MCKWSIQVTVMNINRKHPKFSLEQHLCFREIEQHAFLKGTRNLSFLHSRFGWKNTENIHTRLHHCKFHSGLQALMYSYSKYFRGMITLLKQL